jgi:Domain of unknown function (DUF4838)
VLLGCGLGLSQQLVLTTHNHSDYIIVRDSQASPPEVFASQVLQKYIGLASGVKLPIATEGSQPKTIWIGGAAGPKVIAGLKGRGEESYLVRIADGNIYLAGNSPRATLYSVYDFLEREIGCGWIAPGDDHVPRNQEIRLPEATDRVESPAFSYRAIALFPLSDEQFQDKLRIDSLFPYPLGQIDKDRIDWAAKSRLNYVVACTNERGPDLWDRINARQLITQEVVKRGLGLECCGHSYFAWVPPERYFKDHPEYFAAITTKDTAVGPSAQGGWPQTLNIANPEVAAVMARNIDNFLNRNPEVSIVTLWMNDSNATCTTPECLKMEGAPRLSISQPEGAYPPIYSFSNATLKFANEVARIVRKTHPHVMISHLAYGENIDAPTDVKPEENILVTFAPIQRAPFKLGSPAGYYVPLNDPTMEHNKVYLNEIRKWLVLTKNFNVWDYYSLWWIFSSNRPRWQFPIMSTINSDLKFYRDDLGLTRVSSEVADWHEGNMYVYARIAWNPDLSWRQVLEEFCRRSYGTAFDPMLQQWLVLESAKEKWFEKRAECEGYLRTALEMATTTETRQRINRIARLWHESYCQKEGDSVGPCKP